MTVASFTTATDGAGALAVLLAAGLVRFAAAASAAAVLRPSA